MVGLPDFCGCAAATVFVRRDKATAKLAFRPIVRITAGCVFEWAGNSTLAEPIKKRANASNGRLVRRFDHPAFAISALVGSAARFVKTQLQIEIDGSAR